MASFFGWEPTLAEVEAKNAYNHPPDSRSVEAPLESDVISPDAGKEGSKSKEGKKEQRVMIDGKIMTVDQMKEQMASPGPEFYQKDAEKNAGSSPQVAQQQTATTTPEGEESGTSGESGSDEGSASEVEEPEGKGKPRAKGRKRESLDDKSMGKLLKLLEAGWFPKKSMDGTRMYLHSADSDSHQSPVPFNQAVWDFCMANLSPIGKDAMANDQNSAKKPAGTIDQGMNLLGYMTTKATHDVPLIRNELGKISFMQQALYDLGWMTFLKLSKAPGLLPDDLWTVTLHDDPTPDAVAEVQKVREYFAQAFGDAEDTLLRSMNAANEIASLDHELSLESGRLMMARNETQKAVTMAKFYEERLRIALACMPPAAVQEYVNRTTVMALANSVERGEAAAVKAQIAQEGSPAA